MPEHAMITAEGRTLELGSLGVEVCALGELVVALAATETPGADAVQLLACKLHRVAEDLEALACGLVS